MAADPTLVQGAYIANAPQVGQWDAILEGLQTLSTTLQTINDSRVKRRLAEIEAQGDRRIKGDDWTLRVADAYGKNVNGPLGTQLSTTTDDVTWEKEIYLNADNDIAYQANLTNFNNQAAANTATMSALLGLYDKSLNEEGDGAPISNSAMGWEFDYLVNRKLATTYTFDVGGEEVKKTHGIDDAWFEENNEAIIGGDIKMLSKNYGLFQTTVTGSVATTVVKSAEDVQRDIERTKVNIDARGKIADLGANQLLAGKNYLSADPGRYVEEKTVNKVTTPGYVHRRDARVEFNPGEVNQAIDAIIHPDIRDHEMRSIISDPMIGSETSLLGLYDGQNDTYSKGHISSLLTGTNGAEWEKTLESALFPGATDNNNEIDTDAEVKAVMDALRNYGSNDSNVDLAIKDVVREYLFLYARNNFLTGAGGSYKEGLGVGQVLEEGEKGDEMFEFID